MSKEIERMKKSLVGWLQARVLLKRAAEDKISGASSVRAKKALEQYKPSEVALGKQLRKLLAKAEPDMAMDLPTDPVELAKIALKNSANGPQAQGILPLLVVAGAAALIIMSAISSWADKAKHDRTLDACEAGIQAACPTDWGKWIKWALLLGGAYFVVFHTKLGTPIRKKLGA